MCILCCKIYLYGVCRPKTLPYIYIFRDDTEIDSADEALELSMIIEHESSDVEVVPVLEGSFVEVDESQGSHECSICSKTFSTKYNLRRHIRIHSSTSIRCTTCSAVLESDDALKDHMSAKQQKDHFIC